MNPSECLCVAICVYLGCRQAQTCPLSGHTEERDAIAGRTDEWVARCTMTKTNVTTPISLKEGRVQPPRGDHVMLTTSPSKLNPLLAVRMVVEESGGKIITKEMHYLIECLLPSLLPYFHTIS